MIEKFGKFLRDLFVHGPKGLEQPAPTEVGKPINDKVEEPAPKVEAKPAPKDNVVVAPIKKEKAARKPAAEPATKPATKPVETTTAPKATRARKPTTPKK